MSLVAVPSEKDMRDIEAEIKEEGYYASSDSVIVNDAFKIFLADMAKYPLLTYAEEKELTNEYYKTKDETVRNKLVNHNLRLVINIARHYYKPGGYATMHDLVQEGALGLMRGIEMFEPERGYRLSTYATWWIKQAITRYLSNTSSIIRVPVHMNEELSKYHKVYKEILQEKTGVEPRDEELAKKLKVPLEKIRLYKEIENDVLSLDVPVGEKKDITLSSFIPALGASVEDQFENVALHSALEECLMILPTKERDIVKRRFGMDGYQAQTLEEIGHEYGVTRERIRQLEANALRRLSNIKYRRKLKDFMEG